MARGIYITSAEGNTGKSTIALGVLATLTHSVHKVGVFRPIARSTTEPDYVLDLLLQHDSVDLSYDDTIGVTYEDVHTNPDAALARIVERYKNIERQCDIVVILGSDYTDVSTPTELSYNARIAANLGAPVLLVLGGLPPGSKTHRTPDAMRQLADITLTELAHEHAQPLAIIANRSDPDQLERIHKAITKTARNTPAWVIPENPVLVAPTVRAIMHATEGTQIKGDPQLLDREALGTVIAAMSVDHTLERLIEGSVVITPGDRTEMILALLLAHESNTFPNLAGIVINGGFTPPPHIDSLIDGIRPTIPIIASPLGTFDTAVRITQIRPRLAADSQRKHDTARALFEQHIDTAALLDLLQVSRSDAVTPLMFEYSLIERARANRRHIVLPEGDDDRILRAAHTVLARGIADLTILGEEIEVRSRAIGLGLDIQGARVISSFDEVTRIKYAEELARLRHHRGVTYQRAYDTVTDPNYYGALMVHLGQADGMVSGAAHTTAQTVRPAFEIIKTAPGVSVVSSVFLMALADRVLVYGDCAVIPDPTIDELADIAVSAVATSQQFGIEPRVAMLSYSTGESGTGADVDKVRAATAIVRERLAGTGIPVDGPIQYDAAADAAVARTKLPDSEVAGRATVFIFPDLNTGNNTYKAVQRSAGAVAIGPVMQGLRLPVNDLSRGATVQDIVNTIAITAIQAQAVPDEQKAQDATGRPRA